MLKEKIDVSYTSCFRRDIKLWHKAGLTHADYRPIMLMSTGYSKKYRKDVSYIKNGLSDIKPEINEIVKWI